MPDVPVDERSERRFTVADFWSGLHDLLHPVEPLSDRRWEVLMAIVEERISRRARRFLEAERDEVRRLREIEEAARVALDATEEPCTCYEEPYAPCSYCGPFMRLRTALDADTGGRDDG